METNTYNYILGYSELIKVEEKILSGTMLKTPGKKQEVHEVILSDSEGENEESESEEEIEEEKVEEKVEEKKEEEKIVEEKPKVDLNKNVEKKIKEKIAEKKIDEIVKNIQDAEDDVKVEVSQGDVKQTESIIIKDGKKIKRTKRVSVTKLHLSKEDKNLLDNAKKVEKKRNQIRETQEIIMDNEFGEESHEEESESEQEKVVVEKNKDFGLKTNNKRVEKPQVIDLENENGEESEEEEKVKEAQLPKKKKKEEKKKEPLNKKAQIRETQEFHLNSEEGEEQESESEEEEAVETKIDIPQISDIKKGKKIRETQEIKINSEEDSSSDEEQIIKKETPSHKNKKSQVDKFIKSDDESESLKKSNKEFVYEEEEGYEFESEDEDSESEEDETTALKLVKNKDTKISYNFEDNSMRQTLMDEDVTSEEEENFEFIKKKKNTTGDYDKEEAENRLILKKKMSQLVGSIGCCFFIFIVSSLLWIILFKRLHDSNNYVANIVLNTPTLGVYHDLYTDFYTKFDTNRDKMFDTERILEVKENDAFSEFKGSVGVFLSTQAKANDILLDTKVLIFSLNSRNNGNMERNEDLRRILPTGDKKDIEEQEKLSKIITNIEKYKEYIDQMKDLVKFAKERSDKFRGLYDQVIENLHKLYENCFSLIDLYGDFYIMTNRIWVTTENIFRLFERRSEKVKVEIKKEHFSVKSNSYKNIVLNELNYLIGAKIPNIELTIEIDEPSDFLCEVSYMIKNDDLTMVDNVYNLYLIEDEKFSSVIKTNSDFNYRIQGKNDINSFDSYFSLGKGTHKLELYAKLKKGNVGFADINIECLEFLQYPRIREYEK